jgi:hypothetical protein
MVAVMASRFALVLAHFLAFTAWQPAAWAKDQTECRKIRDYTPPGIRQQPSFVSDAGTLNKNEHAVLFTINGDVLPPALMVGYRYGLYYWWDIGLEVGGDYGVFQALFHTKFENWKTIDTERFYWGARLNTGYKQHQPDLTDQMYFDDNSWVYELTNTLSLRFGREMRRAFYLNTSFYIDQDIRGEGRQTDYYFRPAVLGFETVLKKHGNFFLEAGVVWSINGMETDRGVEYDNSWFPVARLGFAIRTDDLTAIYYTRDTRHQATLE